MQVTGPLRILFRYDHVKPRRYLLMWVAIDATLIYSPYAANTMGSVSGYGRVLYGRPCNGWKDFLIDEPTCPFDGQSIQAVRNGFVNPPVMTVEMATGLCRHQLPHAHLRALATRVALVLPVAPIVVLPIVEPEMAPAERVVASVVEIAPVGDLGECIICKEQLKEVVTLTGCNHKEYHFECISKWLAFTESRCCVCRATVSAVNGMPVEPKVQRVVEDSSFEEYSGEGDDEEVVVNVGLVDDEDGLEEMSVSNVEEEDSEFDPDSVFSDSD